MKKPLIGVVPLWNEEKDSIWMLPGYIDGIEQAGGSAISFSIPSSLAAMISAKAR